ncbi:MAG: ribonucleoside-diphosphate reductase alpha chain, partial [Parasphingorhabdus sp.]
MKKKEGQSMSSAPKLKTVNAVKKKPQIQMQHASLDIWDKKYRLKDKEQRPVDADIDATYQR